MAGSPSCKSNFLHDQPYDRWPDALRGYSTMPSLVSVAATLTKMVCSSMPIQKLQWCSAA